MGSEDRRGFDSSSTIPKLCGECWSSTEEHTAAPSRLRRSSLSRFPHLLSCCTVPIILRFLKTFFRTRWRHRQISNSPCMLWVCSACLCGVQGAHPTKGSSVFAIWVVLRLSQRKSASLPPCKKLAPSHAPAQTCLSVLRRPRNTALHSFIHKDV